MNQQFDWDILGEHLQGALALPAPERPAFVDRISDPHLRAEVHSLLRAEENNPLSNLVKNAVLDLVASGILPSAPDPLTSIGPYLLIRQIGEGGMGTVYEAEQQAPLRRTVALKLIKFGMDSRQVLARFEVERLTLALMDHPNIARVLDAGAAPNGRPYFVMEFIRGESITSYCVSRGLGLRERLALFIPVCLAIQHAHQKGIIHRDLKPSNVLVGEQDGQPVPKVIDFGLAKATSPVFGMDGLSTQFGSVGGTLLYMSPEQASLNPHSVDTRSDVYSLGVLLYELLTGATPIPSLGTSSGSFSDALARVQTWEPSLPSTHARELRGELDWIVMRALEKDRRRRYQSASALALDLQHYLAGDAVDAGPASRTYRLRKLAVRHRFWLAAAACLLLVLVSATAISLRQAYRAAAAEHVALQERDRAVHAEAVAAQSAALARQERDRAIAAESHRVQERNVALAARQRADVEAAKASAVSGFLRDSVLAQASANAQASPNTKPDPDLKVRTALDRAAANIPGKFSRQPEVEAAVEHTIATAYVGLGLFPEAQRHAARAVELRLQQFGANNRDYLQSLSLLAGTWRSQGRLREAEQVWHKTIALQQRALGSDDPDTLASMHGLAALWRSLGKYKESEALYRQVLAARLRVLGTAHPDTLTTMNNLGLVCLYTGKYAEAEQWERRTLDTRRRVLGEEHPSTLISEGNLALAYLNQGNRTEALRVFLHALDAQRRILGETHPDTLNTANNLGNVYMAQSAYPQAIALYTRTLEATRRGSGPTHLSTLNLLNNLANAYESDGQYQRAEDLQRDAVQLKRGALGPEHPETLRSMSNLAGIYTTRGNFSAALPLFQQVVELRRRILGSEHPNTLSTMKGLGRVQAALGDFVGAIQTDEEVLAARRRILGENHPDTLSAASQLAVAYASTGQHARAEALCLQALQASQRLTGVGSMDTIEHLEAAALIYRRQQNFAAAETYYRQTLIARERRLGPQHPDTLLSMYLLAETQYAAGEAASAEPLLRRALGFYEQVGRTSWDRFAAQALLGRILAAQSQPAAAATLLQTGAQGLSEQAASIPAFYRYLLETR